MKINTLGHWKHFTTWGGSVIAICGYYYGLSLGKFDVVSGSLAGGGLLLNAIGNLIGIAQSKKEKDTKEKAERRLRDLEEQRLRDWNNSQPRHFPKEKIPDFIREVRRGIDGPVALALQCLRTEDGEAHDLAVQICDAFGFDHSKIGDIISMPGGAKGIQICDNTTDGTPTLMAQNLMRAFDVVGLKTTYKEGSKGNKQPLIIIGKKTT